MPVALSHWIFIGELLPIFAYGPRIRPELMKRARHALMAVNRCKRTSARVQPLTLSRHHDWVERGGATQPQEP